MIEKVNFQPNVPVRLALKFADGKLSEGRFGDQMYYTFTDNRGAYLDLDVAAKINQLELKPGEPFEICKYHSGRKGDRPQWDVRRVEGVPAQPPEPPLERDLRRSLEARGIPAPMGGQVTVGRIIGTDVSQTSVPVATAPIGVEQLPDHKHPKW